MGNSNNLSGGNSNDEQEIQPHSQRNLEFDTPNSAHVKKSPLPGITLKRIFRGHTSSITNVAWSPDGLYIASSSLDGNIRIWDVKGRKASIEIKGNKRKAVEAFCVTWSPDGTKLASGYKDGTILIIEIQNWRTIHHLAKHTNAILSIAWSPDGSRLGSGSLDESIRIWDTKSWKTLSVINGQKGGVTSMEWSPDGQFLATISKDSIQIWSSELFCILQSHLDSIISIAWMPNRPLPVLVSGSKNATIQFWGWPFGQPQRELEGHTAPIRKIAFSKDSSLLASLSDDNTIRFWDTDNLSKPAILENEAIKGFPNVLAFHPFLPQLAILSEKCLAIRILNLNKKTLMGGTVGRDPVRYITAKLVLVGDSGVGKTGLGWRLSHGNFKEQSSTHGQQFWIVEDLCITLDDGTKCEAVLWDLAGQHIYRPIHAIFLDNVNLALVLFDPTNKQDTLKGVHYWLEQLAGKKILPPSILVGARLDRGFPAVSQQELDQFCQRHGISGGYIGTSAKDGYGLDLLMDILRTQIQWDQMTSTVTTVTFKRIKEYILKLKENPERENVLVDPPELCRQLHEMDPAWEFTIDEMMIAAKHLENHGFISILETSFGEKSILLTPELLIDLASSIFLLADKQPRELGALNETRMLQGGYAFKELEDLTQPEQHIMLDATVARFLEHNICFRETFEEETLLIFPGLIKQKRPLSDEFEVEEDISYIIHGKVENIYAALVVLLGYAPMFTPINQWKNQAQYETSDRQICGFRMIEEREGEIEFIIYYSKIMPEFDRKIFRGLFEKLLYQHDIEIRQIPPVICSQGHRQDRATLVKWQREDKKILFCRECGEKILIKKPMEPSIFSPRDAKWIIQRENAAVHLRSAYEYYLWRVKSSKRDQAKPRCYISCLPEQATWASDLSHDLQEAGVYIIGERNLIEDNDYIIIVDTPQYRENYEKDIELIADDVAIIRGRLAGGTNKGQTVIFLRYVDGIWQEPRYVVSLFDLVLILYSIPIYHQAFEPLRQSLREKCKQTLEEPIQNREMHHYEQDANVTKKVYIEKQALTIGTFMTGDIYKIDGNAAAVGPNAKAHDVIQIQQKSLGDIDLGKLADDLERLRSAMNREVTTDEQQVAVGEVANAKIAAKKGDGPKAMEHLKSAGKWALSCAEKIGVPLAIDALRLAMRL